MHTSFGTELVVFQQGHGGHGEGRFLEWLMMVPVVPVGPLLRVSPEKPQNELVKGQDIQEFWADPCRCLKETIIAGSCTILSLRWVSLFEKCLLATPI